MSGVPAAGPTRRPAAVVFDLDGVLVDSERFWREVEQDVFASVGIQLDDDLCRQTLGLRVGEVVAHWYRLRPWAEPPPAVVERRLVDGVVQAIRTRGRPVAGARHALDVAGSLGVPLGVASSSTLEVIDAALERLGVAERFTAVSSAQDLVRGKPDPEVYLVAAALLGVDPGACTAVEDSPAGVAAAVSAGMRCVAVPQPGTDPALVGSAHLVLPSLDALTVDHLLLDGPCDAASTPSSRGRPGPPEHGAGMLGG